MAPLELLFRELDAGRALVSTISMSIVAHAGTIIVTLQVHYNMQVQRFHRYLRAVALCVDFTCRVCE